jgi:plasmid stabilization system protein ParE
MTRMLVLSTKAEADLAEAVEWYNRIRPGLGDGLVLCVEQANDRILDYPEAFPVILPGVRRALVRRYPYGVFFRVRSMRVEVEAIFHLRQDPARLTSRFDLKPE